jgi:hypothetical protein
MTQPLHADGFLLRPLVPDDAPAMAAAVRESMASLGPWMPWADPTYDDADALAWIAFCDAARTDGSAHEFGIFQPDGRHYVGAAGLNQFNRLHGFCNLGYWVRTSARGQGAALAAIRALSRFASSASASRGSKSSSRTATCPASASPARPGPSMNASRATASTCTGALSRRTCCRWFQRFKTDPSAPPPRWPA